MAALLTESTGYAYSSTSVTRGGGRVGAGSKQHACEGFHCQLPCCRRASGHQKTKKVRVDSILADDEQ